MHPILNVCIFSVVFLSISHGLHAQYPGQRLASTQLDTGTRVYDVIRGEQVISTMTITLSREDLAGQDAYFSRRVIQTPLDKLEQDVVFDAQTLQPIGAEGASQSRFTIDYVYHNGRVTGTITTPDSIVKYVNRNISRGTLFPWMYEHIIALTPLDSGKALKTPVLHTDAKATYTIAASVGGDTTITVSAGTFQVYPLRMKGRSSSVMYVRKEMPHINIKQTVEGMPVRIELRSYPKPVPDTVKSADRKSHQ